MQPLDVLKDAKNKRVLIVGEISALHCSNHNGIEENMPTSAALTALYVSSLGANVSLAGSAGVDHSSSKVISLLKEEDIDLCGIAIDPFKDVHCWKKTYQEDNEEPLNPVTENQILNSALEKAKNSDAILYIYKNPSVYNTEICKELKKFGEKNSIPFIVFSCFPCDKPSKYSELFIAHLKNGSKPSQELRKKTKSKRCLFINKSGKFCLISDKNIDDFDHSYSEPINLYQYEAALSAIATTLLACNKLNELPKLASKIKMKPNHTRLKISST